MKVISVINQKGGVGKTTTTLHTASYLAKKGYKILMIDSDPQTDLSKDLGLFSVKNNIKELLVNSNLQITNVHENLDLIAGYNELELIKIDRRTFIKAIDLIKKTNPDYDYIFIDCQPKLIIDNLITINESILCATDYMIVPLDADIKAIDGANNFLQSVNRIRTKYNEDLKVLGMLFSIIDVRESIFKTYYSTLREMNSSVVFKTYIRKDTKIKHAAAEGLTIFDFAPKTNAALDFVELGEEIFNKLKEDGKK